VTDTRLAGFPFSFCPITLAGRAKEALNPVIPPPQRGRVWVGVNKNLIPLPFVPSRQKTVSHPLFVIASDPALAGERGNLIAFKFL
jgi:hypothetical protein